MNDSMRDLMREAARLTRAGDLAEATATFQAALMGQLPAQRPAASQGHSAEADDVIDVDARIVGSAAAQAPASPSAVDGGDRFIDGSFTHGSETIDYKLYVPPAAAATEPRPLVLMLHGCTQSPDDFAAGTGMNSAARREGAYVLYPAQRQRANSSRCWNWFKHSHQERHRGEPALLAALTRSVMQTHPIDPDRVHVAGLSAGGAMAAILGATHADLFAAVGVHSGLARGAASDLPSALAAMHDGSTRPSVRPTPTAQRRSQAAPTTTLPTIVFHGDQDGTVHPANGEDVIAACLAAAGRVATPTAVDATDTNGRRCTRTVYRTADGEVLAEHWVVHGAGHAWSGGSPAGSYTDSRGPDASAEMLRFFREHPRRSVRP